MNFAYWRKCDFQIHTPRDPNWTGPRPIGLGDLIEKTGEKATAQDVDDARLTWANDFVDQCVAKGLQAVALTDHHEMVMVSYVEKVVAKRIQSDPNFTLWVFPGMELTASGGKQCLILFDCNLSESWRRQAQGKLGIVYADLEEKHSIAPKVTQLNCNYTEIAHELDDLVGLRGKFIILPNVSRGGSHTVLVDGAHGDFCKMPYVGGYLDRGQTLNSIGAKNRQRLSGSDKTWCRRTIYPLPTSDSRSASYVTLGQNNCWIKLAVPTAEAVRQAFLGYKSRIAIQQPQVPSLVVSHAEIYGSTILRHTKLPLSHELNSAIGGRGSGKSSFLEYISFGLGRSCYDLPRDHYSGTTRLHDLINDTLVSKGGYVTLIVLQDSAEFKVSRGPASAYRPQITYPNGSTQVVTTKELRALFPAVVYSQGELAEIGKQAGKKAQLADLLQFVNADFKREDDRLTTDIESSKGAVRSAVQALVANWTLQSSLRKLRTERESLSQRVQALERTLPALSGDEQSIVARFDMANEFESKRLQASKHADQIVEQINTIAAEQLNERDLTTDLVDETAEVRQRYHDLYMTFAAEIDKLNIMLNIKKSELSAAEVPWVTKYKEARVARDSVLQKFSAHKTVTAQIIKRREDMTEMTNQIGDLESRLQADGDRSLALNHALVALKTINHRRAARTREWANEIERLSSRKIRALVDMDADTSEIIDAVDYIASKTGSQEATRLKAVNEALSNGSAWDLLDRLRTDCLNLLYWRQLAAASGEDRPKCADLVTILGDTGRIRSALAERMDTSRVELIATACPRPEITLSYCDGTREIAFEKASEGQRAAALLFMLLEQAGGPLIIDQPEGDLDNRIIADLTDKLHNAKQNRQLIFASHNANIVVNGSSELVGHLDVKEDGERHFECAGAIDAPAICGVITATMEGGERAFKDRQDKYGY